MSDQTNRDLVFYIDDHPDVTRKSLYVQFSNVPRCQIDIRLETMLKKDLISKNECGFYLDPAQKAWVIGWRILVLEIGRKMNSLIADTLESSDQNPLKKPSLFDIVLVLDRLKGKSCKELAIFLDRNPTAISHDLRELKKTEQIVCASKKKNNRTKRKRSLCLMYKCTEKGRHNLYLVGRNQETINRRYLEILGRTTS